MFRLTLHGPRYLLVEASGTRDRWVLPKGRVEDAESGATAALREVGEEAGVRARVMQRVGLVEQKKDGERIRIAYFLMAYAGRTQPLERRRVRWLTYDDAVRTLDIGKSRRVLRVAHRLISDVTAADRRRYHFRHALAGLCRMARARGAHARAFVQGLMKREAPAFGLALVVVLAVRAGVRLDAVGVTDRRTCFLSPGRARRPHRLLPL